MEGYVNALFTWIWFIGDKRKQALVSIFRVWMQTAHKYENLNPGCQSSSPSQATNSLKLGLSRTKLESKSRTRVLQHWLWRLTSQGIRWSREQPWLYLGEIGPLFFYMKRISCNRLNENIVSVVTSKGFLWHEIETNCKCINTENAPSSFRCTFFCF